MNHTPAHLVGKDARYLNTEARRAGLIGTLRKSDGTIEQARIIRCRRQNTQLQALTHSGEWLPIVHMWNG